MSLSENRAVRRAGPNQRRLWATVLLALLAASSPAAAHITLSDLVIELASGKLERRDIELLNEADERAYVMSEPFEIVAPGTTDEHRSAVVDPEQAGLLVSPARMIVEPRQRRLIRVSAIGPAMDKERVYRLTVRPVTGGLVPDQQGLQVAIGYDVLVLVRPVRAEARLADSWDGTRLTLSNEGNVSLELSGGRGCAGLAAACRDLPGKRLYAGASWTLDVGAADTASFTVKAVGTPTGMVFHRGRRSPTGDGRKS